MERSKLTKEKELLISRMKEVTTRIKLFKLLNEAEDKVVDKKLKAYQEKI
jgi:hypothetical protein